MPPLSSPKDGPPHRCSGPKPFPVCDMRPSGGGYLRPVTSRRTVTGLGLPPNVFRIRVAIGQLSTDSIRARRAEADGSSVAVGRAAPSERAQHHRRAWDHRQGRCRESRAHHLDRRAVGGLAARGHGAPAAPMLTGPGPGLVGQHAEARKGESIPHPEDPSGVLSDFPIVISRSFCSPPFIYPPTPFGCPGGAHMLRVGFDFSEQFILYARPPNRGPHHQTATPKPRAAHGLGAVGHAPSALRRRRAAASPPPPSAAAIGDPGGVEGPPPGCGDGVGPGGALQALGAPERRPRS